MTFTWTFHCLFGAKCSFNLFVLFKVSNLPFTLSQDVEKVCMELDLISMTSNKWVYQTFADIGFIFRVQD